MTIRIERAGTPARRDVWPALFKGARQKCPACGNGSLYARYLKVQDHCPRCAEELHHHEADDAPPYFTIFIVGHVILGGVLSLEQAFAPSPWVHAAIWLPLTLAMSLWMLPRIKGAIVGLQWALRMHGFDGSGVDTATAPDPIPASRDMN